MRVLVIGGGAVGCLVSARIAAAGHAVTLAARPQTAAAVHRQGLRLVEADGRLLSPTVQALAALAEAFAGAAPSYDLAILAVKSYDTQSVAGELRRAAPPTLPVLSVQNGVGNEEVLAAALPSPIFAGALTTPVEVLAPGHVRVARPSHRFAVAPWPGYPRSEAGPSGLEASIVGLFRQAGFSTQVFRDGRALKWSKLLMNILANAQPAILGFTPAQVFAQPSLGNLEVRAWREALAVIHAQNLAPAPLAGYPLALIGALAQHLPIAWVRPFMGRFIAGGRGDKPPSLTFDLHPQPRGRSEVAWLNGAVAAQAQRLGLPAPVNTVFTHVLLDLAEGRARSDDWQGHPQRLLAAVAGS